MVERKARPEEPKLRMLAGQALAAALCLISFALGEGYAAQAGPAEFDALVKAAKSDGSLTLYSAFPENVSKKIVDAFSAKYDIQAAFIRISSAPLQRRYAAEAQAGNIAADLVFIAGGAVEFGAEGVKNGWVEPISESGLPVLKTGEFPKKYLRGATAIIQVGPRLIVYNTTRVKGADVPKGWTDILNPRFKGQILLPDPSVSDVYIEFWSVILDRHGESFFTSLRAQNPRRYQSGIPAIQALAAGEGSLMLPAVASSAQDLIARGAPVATVTPDHTTGVDMQIMLTARSKARHPNAARLLANYVMSSEGNRAFNFEPGNISVYDTAGLPKEYESPKPDAITRKGQILKLLGH